jgi:hypothetical protein
VMSDFVDFDELLAALCVGMFWLLLQRFFGIEVSGEVKRDGHPHGVVRSLAIRMM